MVDRLSVAAGIFARVAASRALNRVSLLRSRRAPSWRTSPRSRCPSGRREFGSHARARFTARAGFANRWRSRRLGPDDPVYVQAEDLRAVIQRQLLAAARSPTLRC